MADELTPRQLEVLRFIGRSVEAGMPPRYKDFKVALRLKSTNAIADHLRALIRKGALEKIFRSPRGLIITASGWRLLGKRGAA